MPASSSARLFFVCLNLLLTCYIVTSLLHYPVPFGERSEGLQPGGILQKSRPVHHPLLGALMKTKVLHGLRSSPGLF